jgi:D-mannonate dehydratase
MAYRPRPSFTIYVEIFLKGNAHFYEDNIGKGSNAVCKYIVQAVKEKMEREPKGKIEMMQKHWNGLSDKEKKEYEKTRPNS